MSDKDFEVVADNFGWIKLSRKIQQNDFWKSAGAFDNRSAWIDILLSASYEKSEVYNHSAKTVITIEPGQMLTSIKSLTDKWEWSYNKVSRYLDNLEQMKMISQKRTTKYTIITILNWDKYQTKERPKKTTEPAEPNHPEQNTPTGEIPVWQSEGFSSEENYIKFMRGEINEVQ